MKICSVELTGNDVNICLLSLKEGVFEILDCRKKKITVTNSSETLYIRQFQKEFAKLMADYKIDHVVIKERPTKGKFSGSATSFKVEAAIQLIEALTVTMVSQTYFKLMQKDHPIYIDFAETGLKKFQHPAFTLGCIYLSEQAAKEQE